jgi:uncharacterized protein YgbK (DUF1537 family)
MIAVIADDFTGAAEIGGIAIRQGFKTLIDTNLMGPYGTDVLIIATNTRAESPEQAKKTINRLTAQLMQLQPEFIYKKIDSVLRGNVAAELLEQIKVSDKNRALIVPSNPSLNRIIKDGIYYYNGAPLDRSNFAANGKIKELSANVIDLIGAPNANVVSKGETLQSTGLMIGNAANEEDLAYWATKLDEKTVMAGGASFFNSLLERKKTNNKKIEVKLPVFGKQKLFVCGSAFEDSRATVATARKNGQLVVDMPQNFFNEGTAQDIQISKWAEEIIDGLQLSGTVIIAVGKLESPNSENLPTKIAQAMADVVQHILAKVELQELAIEGGFTASSIFEKLSYRKFIPVQEFALGVIRMKVEENEKIFLTLKPGSYEWPELLWKNTKMKDKI